MQDAKQLFTLDNDSLFIWQNTLYQQDRLCNDGGNAHGDIIARVVALKGNDGKWSPIKAQGEVEENFNPYAWVIPLT